MNLLPTAYFGPISWYGQLLRQGGLAAIDTEERYVKQTTRNHCVIATANGLQKLTVPVSITHHPTPITQVLLSDHDNWRQKHWNALTTAYGQSPFFDYYADDLRPFFEERRWERLVDYNRDITAKMLELLGATSEDFAAAPPFTVRPYWQVHQQRTGFLPDLSILDLLSNMGPESILLLL